MVYPYFFRIFKLLYGGIDSNNFTTENIHEFIQNIIFSSEVLNKSYQLIFSKNINDNIFGKSSKSNHNLKKSINITYYFNYSQSIK